MKRMLLVPRSAEEARPYAAFFEAKGYECITVMRQSLFLEKSLYITNDGIHYQGKDLSAGIDAALVTDSGYMWPQPVTPLTEEQWGGYKNRLDEFLRNEREASSMWYSFLGILNETATVCINPQRAFEFQAFKPWAFEELRNAGIPLPPIMTGNDDVRIQSFMENHPGVYLKVPLTDSDSPEWLETHVAKERSFADSPALLQALTSKEESRVLVVGGRVVWTDGKGSRTAGAESKIWESIPILQECLSMPYAELTLRMSDGTMLSDFNAAPDITRIPDIHQRSALEAILGILEEGYK
ncbi:MAG: hypothetical protein GF344_09120 [Chitinivibrionales bacterium]|nr:hypothetical protein [Chitinivibrionales bacterium]